MSRREVVELVRSKERFLVTCHRRPDADALGSALGWAAILRELGKEALVWSVDPPPRILRFLPGVEDVVEAPPEDVTWDGCFVMDAAAQQLVPPMPASLKGPVVMFDHHAAHDDFGDIVLREPDAVATGVLVVRMMRELGLERIPASAAKGIYAAIVADTGGFRYPGTSAETLRLGAELLELGADPWDTAYHLFEGWQPERMRLLGAILDRMELALDGRVAVMRVTRAMLEEVGADEEMVEGMVNYGRMLDGVEIAILVWELITAAPPETKVSLRSTGPADVSEVAKRMGGGGHRSAAGTNVKQPLEPTLARALELAAEVLADLGRE